MKCKSYEIKLPDYSVCYLLYDDQSGIDQEDIDNIDRFMEQFYNEAKELNGFVVVEPGDDEPSFTCYPEFGLACDCFDATISILYS